MQSSGLDFTSLNRQYESVPPLREFRARDGEHLSYRFYDSEEMTKVVILLHGSSAHGEYLHPLAERLRKSAEVYIPNLRGHFASGPKRGDCSYIGQLEDDLADLIDQNQLRNKDIFLIGHSSGGGLAIRFAGGHYGHWIRRYILLSPAIPTAPTMRQGNAGGWAKISLWKIVLISFLNAFKIRALNHLKVISFNRPKETCDKTETLSYSFNLNVSYHPRLPYQNDIRALKNRSIILIGSDDEANDPLQYPKVMESIPIRVIPSIKHLEIVNHPASMEAVAEELIY